MTSLPWDDPNADILGDLRRIHDEGKPAPLAQPVFLDSYQAALFRELYGEHLPPNFVVIGEEEVG